MQSQDGMTGSGSADHRLALVHEMSAHNFDLIRFASYRTATKLRFIQKKVSLHALDIWNVIEAFREQGLHAMEPSSELSVARLETLLCSLYHSLNKRAPPTQQAHVDVCSSLLLNWLLAAYCTVDNMGKIKVFSIKVALATLCAGKLMDKLRYIFSQISDSNGLLLTWRFNEYLQEVLALPAAVYESPTFNYTENLSATIFDPGSKVTVNDFLDTMMSDPGPAALVWLPLLHRIATVENTVHPVQCDACHAEHFPGFRYRCTQCAHYTLCQDCFWRGRTSAQHTIEHTVKEYSSYSPTSRTIGASLRKSFRCVPDRDGRSGSGGASGCTGPGGRRFPDQPEKTLNLQHIVPPSPLPSHNGFPDGNMMSHYYGMGSLDSRSTARSLDSGRDDEHRLIARYAAKLAQEQRSGMPRGGNTNAYRKNSLSPDAGRVPSEACLGMDSTRVQRELINQLEAKNREIMREIARLRRQQELEQSGGHGVENPALMHELRALRMRKDELETHLTSLQDSRRALMIQLEGLMKMLKHHQASPRSTPNSSPRSTKSPPPLPGQTAVSSASGSGQQQQQSQLQQPPQPRSAPQTPIGHHPPNSVIGGGGGGGNGKGGGGDRANGGGGGGSAAMAAMGGAGNTNSLDRGHYHHQHNRHFQEQQQQQLHLLAQQHYHQLAAAAAATGGDQDEYGSGGNIHLGQSGNGNNASPGPAPGNTSNTVGGRSLRNDLLVAADSVTNAMSTLVRELNSESATTSSITHSRQQISDFEDDGDEESDSGNWQQELQRRYAQEANFMAELRARQNQQSACVAPQQQLSSPPENVRYLQNHNSYHHHHHHGGGSALFGAQNQHSEHSNNGEQQNNGLELKRPETLSKETLEWEEALKNWVNR